MGFVRRPALYTMVFGGDLAGLEITVRGLTGHTMAELGRAAKPNETMSVAPLFIELVDRWNLEDADGRAVPVTYDAFLGYDMEFIHATVEAWTRDVMGAPYAAGSQGPVAVTPPAPAAPVAAQDPGPSTPHISEFARYVLPAEQPAA